MKLGTRVWALITVVAVLAFVAGGYFLGVAPLLDQRAAAETARQAALAQNQVLQGDIDRLERAQGDLDKYKAVAADFDALIPDAIDSQRFIRSLDAIAAANGVTITKIAIDKFMPYSPPAVDPATEALEGAPPPYTDGRITAENFVIVPISTTIEGGWAESLAFIKQLQTGDRLVLLTDIDQTIKDGSYSTEVSGYMYVLVKPGTPVADDTAGTDASSDQPTDGETASARG